MKRPHRRRSGRYQSGQWPFKPGQKEWTEADVLAILSNPIYGYGINLVPYDTVVEHVQRLHSELAQEQAERGRPFNLEELDQRFRALFTWLEAEGFCQRGPEAPTIVSLDQWLAAQQTIISRLAAGEEP